jgi:hypothetical protein
MSATQQITPNKHAVIVIVRRNPSRLSLWKVFSGPNGGSFAVYGISDGISDAYYSETDDESICDVTFQAEKSRSQRLASEWLEQYMDYLRLAGCESEVFAIKALLKASDDAVGVVLTATCAYEDTLLIK